MALDCTNNYDVVSTDWNRQGGGVCLYIRSNISYINQNDLIPATLEVACAEILKPNSSPFYSSPFFVANLYRPPSSNSQYFSIIKSFIDQLDSKGKELIVVGDLNSNMLDSPNSYHT